LIQVVTAPWFLKLQLVIEFRPGEGDDHIGAAEQHPIIEVSDWRK
jgi:hypothetical protein